MKQWHTTEVEELYDMLETSENGLTTQEAEQRLQKHGKNALREVKGPTLFGRFITQFKDVMVLVLLAAAIISGVPS